MRWGFNTICPAVANTRVWPSGGALTVSSTAIEPDAPGRCSMITGCFQVSFNFCATMRAKKSVAPPGGWPERKRTGFDGYACPVAGLPWRRSAHVASTLEIATIDRMGCMLLRLDAGGLDNRPPLPDLGLLNGGER